MFEADLQLLLSSFASFDPGTNCTTQISLKIKQPLVSVVGSVLAGMQHAWFLSHNVYAVPYNQHHQE